MLVFIETLAPWMAGQAIDGVQYPKSIETVWSAADLRAIGLVAPILPPVPEGKIVTGVTYRREGDDVVAEYELEDEPPAASITYKADVWRRCTEPEAETLRAGLQAAPAKLAGIWNDSQYVDRGRPDEFTTLRDFIKTALGLPDYARADELLAPSE